MQLAKNSLHKFQSRTYRFASNSQLRTIEDAAAFVKDRGFVFLWPIKGITLPSLWMAVAGNRRVADNHDDPGHVTWGWKDNALGKRIWYYGKILRKKATIIDLDVAPLFYALSENYGSPEEDVLIQYHEGHLTLEAKSIFQAILDNGPLDTISIRRKTNMTSKESNSRFDRALSLLQSDFKILPVGVSDAGTWRYAFIYDLTHRHHPEILEKARAIKEQDGRQKLVELYFRSVGAAQLRDVMKLFGWNNKVADQTLQTLVEKAILLDKIELDTESGEWFCLKELV